MLNWLGPSDSLWRVVFAFRLFSFQIACLLCLLLDAPPCLLIAAALAGMRRQRGGALASPLAVFDSPCRSFATGRQQHWGRRGEGAGNGPGEEQDTAAFESLPCTPVPLLLLASPLFRLVPCSFEGPCSIGWGRVTRCGVTSLNSVCFRFKLLACFACCLTLLLAF